MSEVSLHPICIKNQYENNNIFGFGHFRIKVRKCPDLYLELETRPLTEPFRMHADKHSCFHLYEVFSIGQHSLRMHDMNISIKFCEAGLI